jgi:hypothetical protein
MYILWIDYASEGQIFQGLFPSREAATAAMEDIVSEEGYLAFDLYMTPVTADGSPLGERTYYKDI